MFWLVGCLSVIEQDYKQTENCGLALSFEPFSDMTHGVKSGESGAPFIRTLPFAHAQRSVRSSAQTRSASNPPHYWGERWSSRVRQEVTCSFCCRDHVILFTTSSSSSHQILLTLYQGHDTDTFSGLLFCGGDPNRNPDLVDIRVCWALVSLCALLVSRVSAL